MITSVTSEDSDIDAINIIASNILIISNQYIEYPSNETSTLYDDSDESDITEPCIIDEENEILDYIYCISCAIL